jgi:hypothetical protein
MITELSTLKNKWASLELARTDKYLLDPLEAFNLFIGINPSGLRILALDIRNMDEVNLDYFPSWTGAPIEHMSIENRYYLIITLIDDNNANILNDLIQNLVLRFDDVRSLDNALDSFSQWLFEYSWFFKKNRPPLSEAAQRGLIGELIFLKDYIMKNRSNIKALNAWRGHNRKVHDFSFKNGNIEVKTTISKEPKKVTISNEKQLDQNGIGNLFLSVFLLKETDNGKSLPEFVDEIRDLLTDDAESANMLFDAYLKHAKFLDADRNHYESYKIQNQEMILYKIVDGFPRIITLDSGVGNVSYSITLSSCTNFIVDNEELMNL